MNKLATWGAGAIAAVLLVGGGYWLGKHNAPRAAVEAAQATGTPAASERKILYYRNPMGLPDVSPVPKKDSMGMDYVPVYEGEEPDTAVGAVKLSGAKLQKIGVRSEVAQERVLKRTVRAVGMIEANERGLATIAPKFEGWIEKLYVNTTGQLVGRGQAVAEVYSPELVSAQREYLIARSGRQALARATPEAAQGAEQLAHSAAQRLRNWDISAAQIERLAQEGEPRRTLTLTSPVSGVVTEKPAVQGMRFMPGEVLFKIADLSTVWLIAEVFEQDLGAIRVGQQAAVQVNAYPGRTFRGKVSFIYPTLMADTRTARVRIELPNPERALKPAMYGSVDLATGTGEKRIAVPDSAVIDSGTRRVVLIDRGEGRFEPREVNTGNRTDGYVEILEGVAAGEQVVVSANFLIDAESNLKAALGSFGHAHGNAAPGQEAPPPGKGEHAGHQAPAAGEHAGHSAPAGEHAGHEAPAAGGERPTQPAGTTPSPPAGGADAHKDHAH